jgi:hypothetical protein
MVFPLKVQLHFHADAWDACPAGQVTDTSLDKVEDGGRMLAQTIFKVQVVG